jgi:shikimate kinase
VALGGGTCERPQNRDQVRQSGKSVWLQAPLETLSRRIEQDLAKGKRRPALTKLPSQEELRLLAEKREANYAACADLSLSTAGLTPAEVAEKIVGWWELTTGDDKS